MSVIEFALFALWCFALALIGGLAGLVLGNLRLPLVLLFATSPAAGGASNLAISTLAATTAAAVHVKAGRVNWRLVAWMGPPSIIGALIGGYFAGVIPERALLGVIAIILFVSGLDLLRWGKRNVTINLAKEEGEFSIGAAVWIGALIGILGGLVGLILGALRMPALLRFVGESPARATGSNLVIGVAVGVAGFVGHLPKAPPDWRLVAVGGAASIIGAVMGARLTGRLSPQQLIRAIGAVLLLASIATAIKAIF